MTAQVTAPDPAAATDAELAAAVAAETAARSTADATTLSTSQAYVDALIQSRSIKDPVRVVATGNLALTGLVAVDGVTLVDGDRVLAAGQSTPSQNGIYVAHSSSWTRSTDADTSSEMRPGSVVMVTSGTANPDSIWELATEGPITLGTTGLSFVLAGQNAADVRYAIANPILAVTYNADTTVASTTENGVVSTFTYNVDGTIATITRGGVTRTFAYNPDGSIATAS